MDEDELDNNAMNQISHFFQTLSRQGICPDPQQDEGFRKALLCYLKKIDKHTDDDFDPSDEIPSETEKEEAKEKFNYNDLIESFKILKRSTSSKYANNRAANYILDYYQYLKPKMSKQEIIAAFKEREQDARV